MTPYTPVYLPRPVFASKAGTTATVLASATWPHGFCPRHVMQRIRVQCGPACLPQREAMVPLQRDYERYWAEAQ